MLFNSFHFLLFFPAVTALYFLLPHRFRWIHLLAASCLFYMAFIPVYIFILFFLIVVDYGAGILIEESAGRKKKYFLIMSVAANLGVLGFFKYYNFFLGTVQGFLDNMSISTHTLPYLGILLPVGLSFHTFQAMSYTIEVYRGKQPAERHLGIYALYVMFYPQLAAGPIERPQHMMPQFRERHMFDGAQVTRGLQLMLWGFFMKLVVADRLGVYINAIYNNIDQHNGNSILLATFFFSFQVYGDFAGYSLIAIGSARTMGFGLVTNFRRPFFSASMSEFWKRWNMSTTSWSRDYVFVPLGGSRVAEWRVYLNIMIVFLLTGLWHGASWTFVMWGFLNGICLVAGLMLTRAFPFLSVRDGWRGTMIAAGRIGIMIFLFMIFRVFFRAQSVDQGIFILHKIFADRGPIFVPHGRVELYYCWSVLFILFAVEFQQEFLGHRGTNFILKHAWLRYSAYVVLFLLIMLLGVFDGGQFIYFQF